MNLAFEARTAKFEAKQEVILSAAARLFNARGVRATTLANVAAEVGHGVTYYYKRKEDLAAACYQQAIAVMRAVIARASVEPTSEGRVRHFITHFGAMLEELGRESNRDVVTFRETRAMMGADRKRVYDAYADMFREARWLFGKELGLSRRALNARTHLLLTAAVWTRSWINRYDLSDYARISESIADILVRGIGSGEARWQSSPEYSLQRGDIKEGSNEAFLRAATFLVNEQGYLGASVDKISARLNMTKGAFYHYHDNKDELIGSCFARTIDIVRQFQAVAVERNNSGWGRLTDCAQLFIRYHFSPQGPLLRFSSWVSLPEPQRTEMGVALDRLAHKFTGFFVDGMTDGSLRVLDQSVASQLLSGCLNASAELQYWVADVRADEGPELYIKPLFAGILSKE